MKVELKYGQQQLELNFPEKILIPEFSEPQYEISKDKFLADLRKYLPSNPSKYSNIAVVLSDKTRLCGYPEYLPWLIEALEEKGAEKNNIHFYIAYGTHPPQSDVESIKSYGEIFNQYHFVHHDSNDETVFKVLGTTHRGTEVTVRKDVLNSSLLFTFGAISHHYFAGYGGGRKLLFPGLAARKAVYQNHSLFLDREVRQLATGCQPGNLLNNPLADDLREVDTYMPAKISIHGVMNASGKVCQLLVGDSYADFEKVCKIHDGYYRYVSEEKYDLVVASSGGYPKDINFIQAHKSVHHAAAFVKDGGKLVILAECIDKIGSNYFMKFLESGSFESAFTMLEKNYEGNGGTALSMMTKTKRISIYMHTSIEPDDCKTLGVHKIDFSGIQQLIDNESGKIAVIKNASILIK